MSLNTRRRAQAVEPAANPIGKVLLRDADGEPIAIEISPGTIQITCDPDQRDAVVAELQELAADAIEDEVEPLTAADKRKLRRMTARAARLWHGY